MKLKFARTMTTLVAVLFLATFLAIFVPPAAAQATSSAKVEMSVDNIGAEGRLAPEAELAEITVKTIITLQTVGAGCIGQANIKYTVVSPPSYSSPVLNPSQDSVTFAASSVGQSSDQSKPVETKLQVSTTRDAPAFKDDTYKVKVDITFPQNTGGCTITGTSADGQAAIKNDYLPLTQVVPTQYFTKAGQNKKVIFPIDVTNLGNGPTRVKIEVVQPNKNKLDSIIPPAELHLESRATKGPSALFRQPTRIEAQTPHANGYTNSIYSFNVKFISAYDGAGQGTTGDETSVVLSVQVQGVYVPGFDPTSLIAALGIALAGVGFTRRRHG